MGAEGQIARRLLEQARALDEEHREAMEWFRSASARFLHDPTVASRVPPALIEELGRFQEFQPLLLDLETSPELEPREPTLRLLRERAGYLEKMVADLAARKSRRPRARASRASHGLPAAHRRPRRLDRPHGRYRAEARAGSRENRHIVIFCEVCHEQPGRKRRSRGRTRSGRELCRPNAAGDPPGREARSPTCAPRSSRSFRSSVLQAGRQRKTSRSTKSGPGSSHCAPTPFWVRSNRLRRTLAMASGRELA